MGATNIRSLRNVTASLVLYCNPEAQYRAAIKSFLDGASDGQLIIVDNSPIPLASDLFYHHRVIYIFNDCNLGFGKAHNNAIACLPDSSEFHLILNPDISFGRSVIPELLTYFESDSGIGAVMPRVLFPDGTLQRLAKLLPTPANLIIRRFLPDSQLKRRIDRRYELHDLPQNEPIDVPSLSGCFLFVRTSLLRELGGFDKRYFMYLEDVDLVRRIGDSARTVYVPTVSVVHEYNKGSYYSKRLLYYHVRSAIKYFSKWGWWFDSVRKERNSKMLSELINRRG